MTDRNGKFEFSPRFEYIDKRDIRNAFALPRFDDFSKMRELNKSYSPEMPGWSLFRSDPMTQQSFTQDDFESDTSSVGSAGSTGSGHGQPLRSRMTRGPRVHHIPILVEARDDSSGYSSDNRSEESKQTASNHTRESGTAKTHVTQHLVNQPKAQGSQSKPPVNQNKPTVLQHSATPAQRSMSSQEVPSRPTMSHPPKAASQPPSSPPPQQPPPPNHVQPGPFVTQVRVNMPVSVEDKLAQDSQRKKQEKPKPDPRKQIEVILGEMEDYKEKVEKFSGTTKDKNYRYLDEMLTRLMLKLDDVNTEGLDGIRQERKSAVKKIQMCISRLEQKISENEKKMSGLKDESSEPPHSHDGEGSSETM